MADDHKDEDEALLKYLLSDDDAHSGDSARREALGDARRLFGNQARPKPPPFTELERAFLPPGRPFTREDADNARLWARSWSDYRYEAHEVATWLRAGLRPNEASLAALLEEEGIHPWRVNEEVEHPDTGERLTIVEYARRAPQTYVYDRTKTFMEHLDQAGIVRDRGAPRLSRIERQLQARFGFRAL